MKQLPATPELLAVARRVVWFKPPEETLKDSVHFLAHLMTYTTLDDMLTVRKYLSIDDFRHTLEHAPPGIFDERSWIYWNRVCGLNPVPPLPRRHLGE